MRLYFHLIDHQDSVPDLEGVEVDDVHRAKAATLAMLAKIREEDASAARDWSGWSLNATDPVGRVVFSIDLDSAVL
jgi:hypothetical protein